MTTSPDPPYDTIVIGAGMSGLAAGIRLAHYNQRVCILERHTTIGGLNSFYRLRGRNYDVGLHAMTNYAAKGSRRGPLPLLLRQLRLKWEDFALAPQIVSEIAFPGMRLRFSNDIELLAAEVAKAFPAERDRFRRLLTRLADYSELNSAVFHRSAREIVGEILRDPLLIEMLFCPVMWYGNARENDMDWGQFCIMFRSIFVEGLARPIAGVRLILKTLVRRFRALGGELRLRSGVNRLRVEKGRAVAAVLDDGRELLARRFVSSAGWLETMRMCDDVSLEEPGSPGCLSFFESVSILDRPPADLGMDRTIVFFNDSPEFHWRRPEALCDDRTGVVCCPNNFLYGDAEGDRSPLPEGIVRVSSLANFDRWASLPADAYAREKMRWYDRCVAAAVRFTAEFRRHVIDIDAFTPKTIRRFTWKDKGAVYGAPEKRLDGRTHLRNLFICGTDQGYVGIIGTLISGIQIANLHLLNEPSS